MAKKNKKIRKELSKLYGEGCFFHNARCAEYIESIGGIKTYKTFLTERHFSGKKISYQLSLHHLRHKSEGGDTTVENGANIAEVAHQYIHSLPRDEEELINNRIREFKINCGVIKDGVVENPQAITIDFNNLGDDVLTVPVYDGGKEEYEIRKTEERKKREKYQRLKNPTRAMKKRELQDMIDEEWEI